MDTYIGIDLGTSGVKALLVDIDGNILSENSVSYPSFHPQEGYSEQNPEDWYEKTLLCLDGLLKDQKKECVRALAISGQMHGLVLLDKDDKVIRPSILWNDSRSEKECSYLNNVIGKNRICEDTGNIAFPGFMAPKILWVYEHEKENFERIDKIMLPKDYLIYKFSGCFVSDVSDASGMLLLDVKKRTYSSDMLDLCHIKESMLPRLFESYEVIGNLSPMLAERLGLSSSVKIVAGAGDNAGAAVGTGCVKEGDCNISLGTSGTIFMPMDNFVADKENALHSFCDSSGKYHLMGCILTASSARSFWLENILNSNDYDKDESELADSDVIFLPYLCGERSPHNDVDIRGAFISLSINTTRGQMSKAIMEGVAFALKDCLNVALKDGIKVTSVSICGGGARSSTWRQIVSDVLGIPLKRMVTNQGPSYGSAILAMVGDGKYASIEEACSVLCKVKDVILPDDKKREYYERKYARFVKLYPALKEI